MKTLVALSLLTLALVQQALCTHLETCECHEIRELVNSTVREATKDLEKKLSKVIYYAVKNINTTDDSDLEGLENRLIDSMERLIAPIQQQLNFHLPPPEKVENSQDHPHVSCKDILEKYPHAPSGYYWITKSGPPVEMYCSMNFTCGGETGAWMRVADIDMKNDSHTCPSGLQLISSSAKRLCSKSNSVGCVSSSFNVQEVQYSRVCGRIIAYHNEVPIAFFTNNNGIDGNYVFGMSLTHAQSPRKHIWTFAAASDESDQNNVFKCPCINRNVSPTVVPSFIGNDYFCDTAVGPYYRNQPRIMHTTDPLWDGKGCGPTSTCCSFNTPPWFVKALPSSTTDNIELRMCQPRGSDNSYTPFEIVELYVQ